MAKAFRYADDARDPWDRQIGEPAEEYDWFAHYRNEGGRRSHVRVAEKFQVTRNRIARVAKQNRWSERYGAFKAANTTALRERYAELVEQTMVPFAQSMIKLAARAVSADTEKIPADRAFTALVSGIRLAREPGMLGMFGDTDAGETSRELDALDLVLDTLAEQFPDAHDAILDRLDAATAATAAGTPIPPAESPPAGNGATDEAAEASTGEG